MEKLKLIFILLFVFVSAACAQAQKEAITLSQDKAVIACKDPRPQICTREYKPVCAYKDNGKRCITQPCPNIEKVTYATGCTACADEKVISYQPGPCKTN